MKRFYGLLLLSLSLLFNQTSAKDVRDAYGRTFLINFIIDQEAKIKSINTDIKELWDVCYYYEEVFDGVDVEVVNDSISGHQSTKVHSKYRLEKRRRPSCTDADIQAHKNSCRELENTITNAVYTIKVMGESENIYINAKDDKGYAAQNYCYTYKIYEELRNQGAEFQYMTYMYFNPVYGTLGTTAAVIGTWCLLGLVGVGIQEYYAQN